MYTCICACIYVCVYVYIYIHMCVYTHGHTRSLSKYVALPQYFLVFAFQAILENSFHSIFFFKSAGTNSLFVLLLLIRSLF